MGLTASAIMREYRAALSEYQAHPCNETAQRLDEAEREKRRLDRHIHRWTTITREHRGAVMA